MKYFSDKEYIYYPNSTVPVNKLGIKNTEEIEELEAQLFLKTYKHFHENLKEETVFSQKYLKDIHKFAFSKLYSWAGKYRNKNISNLKNFRNEPKEKFAKKIAYYMCELIALHPFFELNGRIIRLFFDMIAVYNGYEYIDYGNIRNRKNNVFILVSKHCMGGNCQPMEKIILKGLKSKD